MRQLIVFRHAKSSWDDPVLDDLDCPLNARGERNAPEMGRRLQEAGLRPDRLCCSPAKRARETADRLADALGLDRERTVVIDALYPGMPADWLDVVRSLPARDECVLLIGHNPGLTDFVNALTASDIENVPTAGYAAIVLDGDWIAADWDAGRLKQFDFPKSR